MNREVIRSFYKVGYSMKKKEYPDDWLFWTSVTKPSDRMCTHVRKRDKDSDRVFRLDVEPIVEEIVSERLSDNEEVS